MASDVPILSLIIGCGQSAIFAEKYGAIAGNSSAPLVWQSIIYTIYFDEKSGFLVKTTPPLMHLFAGPAIKPVERSLLLQEIEMWATRS